MLLLVRNGNRRPRLAAGPVGLSDQTANLCVRLFRMPSNGILAERASCSSLQNRCSPPVLQIAVEG